MAAVVAAGAKQEEVEVWPENWQTFEVFCLLRTQWRTGFSGPTGLDYAAVYPLIDKTTSDRDEWFQVLSDIQSMEFAALDAISNRQE